MARQRRQIAKKPVQVEVTAEEEVASVEVTAEEEVTSVEETPLSEDDLEELPAEEDLSEDDLEEEEPVEVVPKRKPATRKPVAKPAAKAPVKKAAPAKAPVTRKPAAKPVKKAAAKSSSEDEDESTQESGKRYFKVLPESIVPTDGTPSIPEDDLSAKGGRYTGKTPMQAAKKIFTRICRLAAKSSESEDTEFGYIFSIQETTMSSHKKVFTYQGVRQRLDEPQEISKGDTKYYISFKSTVKVHRGDAPAPAKKTVAKAPTKSTPTARKSATKAPTKKAVPAVRQPAAKKVAATAKTTAARGRASAGRGRGGKK